MSVGLEVEQIKSGEAGRQAVVTRMRACVSRATFAYGLCECDGGSRVLHEQLLPFKQTPNETS
jgi:hypothetical protein